MSKWKRRWEEADAALRNEKMKNKSLQRDLDIVCKHVAEQNDEIWKLCTAPIVLTSSNSFPYVLLLKLSRRITALEQECESLKTELERFLNA